MLQVVLNFWLNISDNLVVSIHQSTQLIQLCHLFSQQSMDLRLVNKDYSKKDQLSHVTLLHMMTNVLVYVKRCSISSETSLELTSKILVIMMCLLSGRRSQTLTSLHTDCMYLNNSGCAFYISKLLKTSRPKSHQQPIQFKAYPHDVSLCVVALIKLYLDKTAPLRQDVNLIFFVSYTPPHKPVSSRTLTRWVSDILHNAGIHTKTFKSRSLRSASTSNAFSGGLSLNEITAEITDSWMDKCKDVRKML